MSQRVPNSLLVATPVEADPLNENFNRLAETIDTVDSIQMPTNSITFDSIRQGISGLSTEFVSPFVAAVRTSTASIPAPNPVTQASTVTFTPISDGVNDFTISFPNPGLIPFFELTTGDVVRWWFTAEVSLYNAVTPGLVDLTDIVFIVPEFNTATVPVWNSYWPTPSGSFASPAYVLGCAQRGNTVNLTTTRTTANNGHGPGMWRTVSLEGVFPVVDDNYDQLDIRITYRMVGTNVADMALDVGAASMQAMLFKKGFV